MSPILRTLVVASLVVGGSFAAWAVEPAPAVVKKIDPPGTKNPGRNAFASSFVTSESLDGIEFLVDDPKGQNKLSLKRGTYTVEYDLTRDVDLLTGMKQRELGKWDAASTAFTKAVTTNRLNVISSEWALRYGAEVALRAGKPDDALAAVAQLEKTAPRSLVLVEAIAVRGQALQAKGDVPGATAAFNALISMSKDFGSGARVRGIRGLAALQAAAKKPDEAAKTLGTLFATMDSVKDAAGYGDTVLELLSYQMEAKQTDAALAIARAAAYQLSESADQCEIQYFLARLYNDKGGTANLIKAFDHAAIATGVRGAPPATAAAALALARQVVDKLQKDASLSSQDKLDYRKCVDQL